MKILVVQDQLRSGGTERQSVLLANAFAASGHAVVLLTFRPGGALAATVSARVKMEALQPFDTKLDWFAPRLCARVRRHSPNVVLLMGRMANCHGALLARAADPRAAVVATMRTGKTLPWLFRLSMRRARHIVANSREAQDTLVRQHRIPAARISVIYNSLVFPPAAGAPGGAPAARALLRSRHEASPATKILLCVAMFRPEKNQRDLIEIAAGLPDHVSWQLWLAGEGPCRRACEDLAAARGVGARVKFLGFLKDPAALYSAADIAVHASSSEALSNFLIEAQAHGLPAVAYDAQGISECFIPGETGWAVAREDKAAFRTTVLQLMSEAEATTRARAAAAQNYARRVFDPAQQAAAYLHLFDSLIERGT